ncbi:hypothetical protein [Pseudonocardia broussonetiae]|uniref:Uncharacterized protein n=1 Tax=Pseudonocardia broussonetiae TaxID=2736640 RepID=A0A6M6JIA0_9PSEU|nr:hypothetical protein [Pseudonocardia broussonetiae]QJY46637.1 hypothetical protein HOP40_13095 [Pseudonocardia broussonetiae]
MNVEALVLAIVLAALLLAAFTKPGKKAVAGFITTDRKTGRVSITVWPGTKKGKKRR